MLESLRWILRPFCNLDFLEIGSLRTGSNLAILSGSKGFQIL
jgi:hypothetical protein